MDHLIICGSILVRENAVLMVQEKKDHVYGLWNLPTGRLEDCESVEECARREAKEETGLDVVVNDLVGVYTKQGGKQDIVLAIVFESSLVDKTQEVQPSDEVLDVKWIPIDEINNYNLRSQHITEVVQDWKSECCYPSDVITTL